MVNLDELERLEKAATPGPWQEEAGASENRRIVSASEYYIAMIYRCAVTDDDDGGENTALIVAARNALPALIEAARVLRDWEQTLIDLDYDGSDWLEMLDRTRAALAALEV